MRRLAIATLLLLGLLAAAPAAATDRPELIRLPDGFQPEGIAAGKHAQIFVGSIPTGAVWTGDVLTGEGKVLVPPHEGRNSIGLKADRFGRLFVAGGPSGGLYVYDSSTGADVAAFPVGGGFVNDVALAKRAAYFTDSRKALIYVLPFDRSSVGTPTSLPLSGDFVLGEGNNLNGIVVAGKGTLVAVQSNTGQLHRIDASSGATHIVDLGGATLPNGDGLLLRGHILLVVQNRLNKIAVVKLSKDFGSGQVLGTFTDPDLDVPTTIAKVAGSLYAVNARFGTAPDPPSSARYDVVRVGLPKEGKARACAKRHASKRAHRRAWRSHTGCRRHARPRGF